jgi:hypothetical protein
MGKRKATCGEGASEKEMRHVTASDVCECELRRLRRRAAAHDDTSRRLDDAQAYCQKHIGAEAWGKNVWHAILDDALRRVGA